MLYDLQVKKKQKKKTRIFISYGVWPVDSRTKFARKMRPLSRKAELMSVYGDSTVQLSTVQ